MPSLSRPPKNWQDHVVIRIATSSVTCNLSLTPFSPNDIKPLDSSFQLKKRLRNQLFLLQSNSIRPPHQSPPVLRTYLRKKALKIIIIISNPWQTIAHLPLLVIVWWNYRLRRPLNNKSQRLEQLLRTNKASARVNHHSGAIKLSLKLWRRAIARNSWSKQVDCLPNSRAT